MWISIAAVLPALLFAFASGPDAGALFEAGNFDAARQAYVARLAAHANDTEALRGLATIELYSNELAQAQRDCARVLSLDPSDAAARSLQRTIGVRLGKPNEFRVEQQGAVTLPFVAGAPLPVVRLRIDGTDANVMIDTGAPTLVVGETFARAHHLAVTGAGQGTFAGGLRAAVEHAMVPSVTAQGLKVFNVPAAVMPMPQLSPAVHVDAVMGTGFFTHFLATMDYPAGRLVLNLKGASTDSSEGERMWLTGDHFIFAAGSVDGGEPQLFNVDSGGAGVGVQLTKAAIAAARIAVDTAHPMTGMSPAGPVQSYPFVAPQIALGAAVQRDVPGVYFARGDQYGIFPFTVAGTVSDEFLKHYAVTFDFASMRIVLK